MIVSRRILLYITLSLFSLCVSAQTGTIIRGTVTDSDDGSRIVGANVTEFDVDRRIIKGTITDVNGNFNLMVKDPKDVFIVSFIGYKSHEFTLDGKETFNIKLESTALQVEEIVITAKASNVDPLTGVSERDEIGARVKFDLAESKHMGVVSAEEALQGRIAGLDIVSSSGNPGSGSQIVIRGLGSLGGSKPLIVVDDIPQDIRIDASFDFGSADKEDIGDLVNISPQDIISLEVLKDAASTAIWGSKGADGVLLIRTQRGRLGKTSFEYNGKYTVNIQPDAIPMLNGDEYIMLQYEELQNQKGVFELPSEIAYDRKSPDFYNYNKNTDWISEITQPGFINDQYFKVIGGGDKTRYFASLNYQKNEGTTINTSLDRLSTRINLDYNLSKKITFLINFLYTNSSKEDNYIIGGNNVRGMAYIKAPNMSIWEYDAKGNKTGEYFSPVTSWQGDGTTFYNPVAVANLSTNNVDENEVATSFTLNYKVASWLRYQQMISYQYLNSKSLQFLPTDAIGADWLHSLNNQSRETNSTDTKILTRSQLFFTPDFQTDVHSLSGSFMMETEIQASNFSMLSTSKGPGGGIMDPAANAQIVNIRSGSSEARGLGMLGNLNYKYKDRYLATLNTRIDGSSKFGSQQRWGMFPSILLGWRFSEEWYMKELGFLSNGKLRVSWGQTGKQPGSAYDRYSTFNSPSTNAYIENPIIIPLQVELENLKWETQSSENIGLDLGFLDDKITMSIEGYRKTTTDILWKNYKIPLSSGYTTLKWYNGGILENKGWEFYLNVNILKKKEFNINMNFNIANNVNVFREFPRNFNNVVATNIGNGVYPRRADIGQPVGSFYGFRYLGVWPSDEDVKALDEQGNVITDVNGKPIPMTFLGQYKFVGGDAIYKDVNHDGNIDLLDVVYLGDSNPDFVGGFGASVRWKKLFLSSQFNFRTGFQIVNEIALKTEGMSDKNNQSKAVLHRWRTEGENEPGIIPRAYMDHPANNLGSDRYVENGDFLRLNSVSLSYSMPKQIVNKFGLNSFDFAFTMRKILTFTNYSGQDPEIAQTGDDPFWYGTDTARTPVSKSYVFSIILGF